MAIDWFSLDVNGSGNLSSPPRFVAELNEVSEMVTKLKMSLMDIVEATGEALPLIRAAINAGDLKTFLVGRRRFARPADVEAWVDFLQRESDAGHPLKYQARERASA